MIGKEILISCGAFLPLSIFTFIYSAESEAQRAQITDLETGDVLWYAKEVYYTEQITLPTNRLLKVASSKQYVDLDLIPSSGVEIVEAHSQYTVFMLTSPVASANMYLYT